MKPPPARHLTLSRVLVLSLAPSLAALALSIYNSEQINADRANGRARIDAEICAVVARIPGPSIPQLERILGCPVTEPVPLPTVTPTTPAASPTAHSGGFPSRAALAPRSPTATPIGAPRPAVTPRPTRSPQPTARPTPSPTPTPTTTPPPRLLAGLLNDLLPPFLRS